MLVARMFPRSALTLLAAGGVASAAPATIEFNRDIRPILSENCFYCHGQDPKHREADLRLDDFAEATRDLGGYAAIAPGKPDASEVLKRLTSHDRDEVMPPPKANKHVKPEEIALLRRWIAEGANYERHWAFIPPRRAGIGEGNVAPASAIDAFVRARLAKEGLAPSPPAAPEIWLRRVSFDLTGLPPTLVEIDVFLSDVATRGEAAYGAVVDRLLASPRFGERQAIEWLDAARYADTHGFNNDSGRTMWRWRDWVIEAFNANMPYDRFITEQLAGDLLSQPTLDQRIATGFGRNHVINSEGGVIDEEYRVEYVADRVRTMSTAWLGLTTECARCHDHKFDPITTRDYYQLFAFFNNVPEHGEDGRVANAVPMIPAPTREQQAKLAEQERAIAAFDAKLREARDAWQWRTEDRASYAGIAALERLAAIHLDGVVLLETDNSDDGLAGGAWVADAVKPAPKISAKKIDFNGKRGVALGFWLRPAADNPSDVPLFSALNYAGSPADAQYGKGQEVRLIGGEIEVRVSARYPVYSLRVRSEGAGILPGEWRHVAVSYGASGRSGVVRIYVDGTELRARVDYDGLSGPNVASSGDFLVGADNAPNGARWRGALDEVRGFPRALTGAEVRTIFTASALPYAVASFERGAGGSYSRDWLRETWLSEDRESGAALAQRGALWEEHLALRRGLPTAMVMEELPQPRPAFILTRGHYDAHGEPVQPGVPEKLLAPWPAGAPRNRLGLAQWLTQPENPLTARVVVNRFWAQLFGTGIVKTLEDFGYQSEWPSHPEVLDWSAREFIDSGWNVKALFKTMVLTATYRQSSAVTPELAARDPENRLLARGPRFRLPAELLRDQALAVSGLLTTRIGGPSVFPYQPEKLYEGVVVGADYPGTRWGKSEGDDLYRRSLYTYWKRTVPHPVMLTFDAPDREFCSVRRSRTNTPLQALVLLNEPGYLEAARQLGTRMLREGGADDTARVAFAFRLATGRVPRAEETRVLASTMEKLRADFSAHPNDAASVLKVGASPVDPALPAPELAAASAVASMILNLDETLTKN
jgi:hypothetical protein